METVPKKLLDLACTELVERVRTCPKPAEGTPSASRAVAGQCEHYSIRTEEAYWIDNSCGDYLLPDALQDVDD
jgi:hypothetical protein